MVFPFFPQTNSLLDLIWLDLRSRKCLKQLRLTGNHHTFFFFLERYYIHLISWHWFAFVCHCVSRCAATKSTWSHIQKKNHTYKYGLYRALFPRFCFMLPWETWSNAAVRAVHELFTVQIESLLSKDQRLRNISSPQISYTKCMNMATFAWLRIKI